MAELRAFCDFCRNVLSTEDGEPLRIEPFQERILADFFAGARETIVIVGRRMGRARCSVPWRSQGWRGA